MGFGAQLDGLSGIEGVARYQMTASSQVASTSAVIGLVAFSTGWGRAPYFPVARVLGIFASRQVFRRAG